MSYQLPPLVSDAQRLMDEVERSVTRFPKAYKYTAGTKLREIAVEISLNAVMAARDAGRRGQCLLKLDRFVDEIKLRLESAHRLGCFRSAGEFENLFRIARAVGKQCGGWMKLHPMGQSPASPRERAPTLSAGATSQGVNA